MNNTKVKIKEILSGVQTEGKQYFNDERIEELESCISECNYQTNLKEAGEQVVSDAIYDKLVEMLRIVKPDSSLLNQIWEEDGGITDYNDQLVKHPMMSINTVKNLDNKFFTDFYQVLMQDSREVIDLFASFKLDGHGIRVVYLNGELVLATSRARASAGRDLTKQLRWLLDTRNESLKGLGLVEIRGELCLPLSNLEKARGYNPDIKSAFSGVSSLVRPSTTEEEVKLLSFLAYRVYSDNIQFTTREEEYNYLISCGFKAPEFGVLELDKNKDVYGTIEGLVNAFEGEYANYDIFCDGVVLEYNNKEKANLLGDDGRAPYSSVALKIGVWGQDVYDGFVKRIEWTKGKSKLSPVAIVGENPNDANEGVLTAQGNTVSRVPLYEPCNILILNAFIGRRLKFKYGGEAGVVPLTQRGELLTEAIATNYLEAN